MDLEITILGEVTERQISYDITCMWNLKNNNDDDGVQTNCLQNGSRVPDVENKLRVTRGGAGRENWEIGINIYTLLYMSFPHGSVVKNLLQCRTWGIIPWVGKIP